MRNRFSFPSGRVVDRTMLIRTNLYLQIAANAAIIFTLVVALFTYLNQIDNQRRAAALGYIEAFGKDELLAARNRIYLAWQNVELGAIPSEALTYDFLREYVVRALDNENRTELTLAIVNIADHLDNVAACVDESVCDAGIIRKHLGEYARDFYCVYNPILERESARLNNSQLGQGRMILTGDNGC